MSRETGPWLPETACPVTTGCGATRLAAVFPGPVCARRAQVLMVCPRWRGAGTPPSRFHSSSSRSMRSAHTCMMGEVHRIPLFLEQVPVSHAAAPQCGNERPVRIGQGARGVDQLVADAVEIAGGLGRRVNPVPPSTLGDYVPAGAEYGVELLVQQQALFTLVQDLVIRLQPRQFSVGESSLCHRL